MAAYLLRKGPGFSLVRSLSIFEATHGTDPDCTFKSEPFKAMIA